MNVFGILEVPAISKSRQLADGGYLAAPFAHADQHLPSADGIQNGSGARRERHDAHL